MSSSTDTGFYIRRANKDDISQILSLINELATYEEALHLVEATEESLLTTLGFNPDKPSPAYANFLLVFEETEGKGKDVAGMVSYLTSYSCYKAKPGILLQDLFVRPEYRGKGYGTALICAVAKELVKIDGERLEWSVLKWNKPSINFYEGPTIGAKCMEEWQTMRVDGEQLKKLAARGPIVRD